MHKYLAIFLIAVLVLTYFGSLKLADLFSGNSIPEGFYFGVTADGNFTTTINLIDKIKDYTNLLLILNPDIVRNKTSVTQVCDYAQNAGLSFFVHMSHPSYWIFDYDPFEWYYEAKQSYGGKFLGYYLYDEPGGNQLDLGPFRQFDDEVFLSPLISSNPNISMPIDSRDAAYTYVYHLYVQMRDFIKFDKLVTSDYGLFWYDYEAGYDMIFCEFGKNRLKSTSIPQCRGAATIHNRTWGVIVTWSYDEPPYLQSPDELYDDLILAYQTGASYVAVFNYPVLGPYGLLSEEYFDVLKDFKDYVANTPRNESSNIQKVAYVLPVNYGGGLRTSSDKIWGVWEVDDESHRIWNSLNDAIEEYGYDFDIVIDSYWTYLFAEKHYNTLIYWNGTIQQLN